ncbi:response regulator [Aquisalimonas asiatica]|uniref:Two-component system, OmpR family, response regulator n=1 Tax=Aquisalimonas asiatica TaxID=406100 RepID=A0A1H8SZ89_9GAMM|nr:response regulator [Aquisalimonas asiatica]SEO83977.1 two-component system, OmpR family, response regulator [Aquisalimonas asiatica]
MRVLVVEDDEHLAQGVVATLEAGGYAVDWIADGAAADTVLRTELYDLVLLDLTLPTTDGMQILRRLRDRRQAVPVLVMTARGDLDERVRGLDLGADDYIVKPFDVAELEARTRALIRRSHGRSDSVIEHGALVFDAAGRRLLVDGEEFQLPRRELNVLEILLMRAGKVVSKEQIASHLFSFDDEAGPNAIEIYVHRLRKKLACAGISIRTVRGLGYLLE